MFDIAERKRLVEGGKAAVDACKDPMIELARVLDPFSRQMRKKWEDEVTSVERENYAKVAAARFAVEGEKVYPDATFTLRLSYGTVKGYEQNGAAVKPFTTFGGAYAKAEERATEAAYALPKSWLDAKGALALETPFNFVSTHDIIGGNSGSPVFNRAGEVVGLIFDGNIESLGNNFVFDDEVARSVSVHPAIIVESLRKVYGAGKLADELEQGAAAKKAAAKPAALKKAG